MHSVVIQRNTRQRQVILDEVKRSGTHPTADEIYERVRTQLPRISLGTVYRNLDILAASGEIVKLAPGRTQMRFDGNLSAHYHMTCVHCGRVEDIPIAPSDNPVDILEQMTSHLTKYGVFGHKLEFVGVCSDCTAQGRTFPETVPMDSGADGVEVEDEGTPNQRKRRGSIAARRGVRGEDDHDM